MTAAALEDGASLFPEIRFEAGLPGFPGVHRFRLLPWGEPHGPFWLLACLDVPALEFVVVTPERFFPGYVVKLDCVTAERLDLTHADEAAVYLVVTLGRTPLDATVNLLGPLVVNRRTLVAAQVTLDGQTHAVRMPLRYRAANGD